MARIINLQTFTDKRGSLTVVEKLLPFDIKRIYYIYNVDDSQRGGHRHKETTQAAICIKGSCKIKCFESAEQSKEYILDNPAICLLIDTTDWHIMYEFSNDAVLLVMASHYFDNNDYIYEPYENTL